MQSDATTVEEYLESLPEDRRAELATVRDAVRAHLPDGYEERMQYGMISYVVPPERKADTYNGQPLALVSLAAQKKHLALYLQFAYGPEREAFEQEYATSGKRLDMGKSCVRFRSADDLALDVIGRAVSRVSVDDYIAMHDGAHRARGR